MRYMVEIPRMTQNGLEFDTVLECVDFETVQNWVECANARYGAGLFNLYRCEYGYSKLSLPAMDYVVQDGEPVYRVVFWDL